ncbi:MAG: hypothetical protein IPL79_03070 [Myxococcales bacterium]|nr:hypothetical protein [Myxococcales bacterium]
MTSTASRGYAEVDGFVEQLVLPFSISAPQLREQEFIVAAELATWMSEIDSGPVYTQVRNSTTRTPTESSVRASFGMDDAFAIKAFSLAKTRAEFTSLGEFDLAWRDVQAFMIKHTGTSYRLFKIGPAVAEGKLIEDQGFYTYLVVGKAVGNSRALVGLFVRSVET